MMKKRHKMVLKHLFATAYILYCFYVIQKTSFHTQSYFVNWGEAEERKRANTTLKRRESPPRSTIFSCGMISNREFW